MANKKIGEIKRKKRGFSFGTCFLGIFIGFILCLGTIAGLGVFAYHNISANWLNDKFNVGVDFGTEEANEKTLKDFVTLATGLMDNIDTYSLNDLEADFGVKVDDKLMGLDITDIKAVAIKDIADEMKIKFEQISADELTDVIDLSSMNSILKKENTYYYDKDSKTLYKNYDGTTFSNPVEKEKDFEYEILGDAENPQIKIKSQTLNVVDKKISIQLKYLPLTTALGDFMDSMGEKITIGELVDEYHVELPSYLYDTPEKKAKTINEIKDVVDGLYVAEFMGCTIQGQKVYNGTTEVKGVMAIVAKKTVKELSSIEQTINDTQIKDILDVNIKKDATGYYDDKNDNNVRDGGEPASSFIMSQVAGQTVSGLSSFISGLKLSQIFEDRSSGILSLIDGDPTIEQIPSKIQLVITGKSIQQLIDKGVVSAPDNYSKYSGDTTTVLKDDNITYKTVAELTLPELLEYCFDKLDELEELKSQKT